MSTNTKETQGIRNKLACTALSKWQDTEPAEQKRQRQNALREGKPDTPDLKLVLATTQPTPQVAQSLMDTFKSDKALLILNGQEERERCRQFLHKDKERESPKLKF